MSSRSEHHAEPPKECMLSFTSLHSLPDRVLTFHFSVIDSEPAPVNVEAVPSKRGQHHLSASETHGSGQEYPDHTAIQQNSPESENVEPLIIASARDLDQMVNDMLLHFEGRESEQNWVARDKDTLTLRRLTRGNAPHEFPQQYLAAMKSLLDGIFKAVTSLRTTLSSKGCFLIQDLANTCRAQIDPMVEIMLQNLLKICGGMKKITAQAGSTTVDVVIGNASYSHRILQHVLGACDDKNAQLRLHAAGWLKTLINKQARHKSSLEHNGGVDAIEKTIKKTLSDANPGVREKMRVTFWTFFDVFPGRANEYVDPCHDHGE